ncbi:Calpain-1 catalytic subunit [Rhizoctonia solani AG-1 IB]|uniref:Calpain-1 catalytic subunit n=1 Tax=Thanatephorus cucumeris (strain AG1-IB / isolate 7/3/14) TaxID=1108050 RepID=M5CF86_THACB|nr:Calpain-1 catalytic subunit [Rhizoctonia solani AG-1 IB]
MIGLLSTHFKKQNAPERQERVLRHETAPPGAYQQETKRAGLLCTDELKEATKRCRLKVEAIAKQCRARNRRFRDVEFDLEEDKERCLHGLGTAEDDRYTPSDVMRVTQIFDKPQFFIDGAKWSDIMQGRLGDCWFLSALATVSTMEDLIEKICVARDEKVGVYGFIFYRDSGWVDVIVDDLLYTSIPKYEQLSRPEKNLYHNDKDKYNIGARKGGQSLYFAKSGTDNETWVPLIEKAYAKLHGDYRAIDGGLAADAIEDLTGGVSTIFHLHDILDEDEFWTDELMKVNEDRLFGCYIYKMPGGDDDITINGLFAGHAYSVISAIEVNGKRFLRVRNPWGKTEWTGAWSDGSKEWTNEWLALLPQLNHKFGNDGEFLMEYKDFLNTWTMVERSRLFDSGWKMSSMWLDVKSRSFPCAWNFGDVSFTFNVKEDTPAVIVLSQLNSRHFAEISGYSQWTLEFAVYRKGAPASEPYASSAHTIFWRRSVNVELGKLEAGDYVVHNYFQDSIASWEHRKLSKVWSEACVSSSIAINFDPKAYGDLLPASIDMYGGQDLTEIEVAFYERGQKKPVETEVAAPLAMKPMNAPPTPSPPSSPTAERQGLAPPTPPSVGGSEVVVEAEAESETRSKPHSSDRPTFETEAEIAEMGNVNKGEGRPVFETEAQAAEICNVDRGEDRPAFETEGQMAEICYVNKGDDDPKPVPGPDDDDKADKDEIPPSNSELGGPTSFPRTAQGPVDPIIGPRYHCLSPHCPDYDLCQNCMSKNVHDASHAMLCIRDPADADKLRDEVAEGEDNSIIVGLRVYTKDTTVQIAGQLRHGKVVAWDRKKA